MSVTILKNEILQLLVNTNDEEILSMVKEELVEYQLRGSGYDVTDKLNAEDLEQLMQLAAEDPLKDTLGIEEIKLKVGEWRSK